MSLLKHLIKFKKKRVIKGELLKKKLNRKTSLIVMIFRRHLAGLASSAQESVSEKCEQYALGLQKFTQNRQLACQFKVEI
jgi:hypothetical protein